MHNHVIEHIGTVGTLPPGMRAKLERQLEEVFQKEQAQDKLRAAMKALHAFRASDLTQNEFNALVGRTKACAGEPTLAPGAPVWSQVQNLLVEDVLKAASAAGMLA